MLSKLGSEFSFKEQFRFSSSEWLFVSAPLFRFSTEDANVADSADLNDNCDKLSFDFNLLDEIFMGNVSNKLSDLVDSFKWSSVGPSFLF